MMSPWISSVSLINAEMTCKEWRFSLPPSLFKIFACRVHGRVASGPQTYGIGAKTTKQ